MSFLSFRCYETRRIFLNRYITRSNILGILVIHSKAGIKPKYYLPIKQSSKQSNNQTIKQSNNLNCLTIPSDTIQVMQFY
jgi:hypothetical protein